MQRLSMKCLAVVASAITLCCSTPNSGTKAPASSERSWPRIALCEMVRSANAFAGRRAEVLARITATKEGSFLWDPGCLNRIVALDFARYAQQKPDMLDLHRALREYGLSDHTVMALLTGTLLLNQSDEFNRRKHTVFEVDEARDVKLSPVFERP